MIQIEDNEPKFFLRITHQRAQEFQRPKYWTGRTVEGWPELLSNRDRAYPITGKRVAEEVRNGFASRGFIGELEPA